MIFGIVTRIDLLNFITLSQQEAAQNGITSIKSEVMNIHGAA